MLVDYRGYRVFAQSIVPGLLQKEHDSSIMYGSMDNGKNFSQNEKFNELVGVVSVNWVGVVNVCLKMHLL